MPKMAAELSAIDVKRLTHPGGERNITCAVGGVPGLLLQITPKGGRTWVLRVKVGDLRREIGLGGYPAVTLAQARDRAREARDMIRQGIDPVEQRKAARASLQAAQARGLTFADAVTRYLAAKDAEFRNDKHRAQWRSTLTAYALPHIGTMAVQDIAPQDVLRVLHPIWTDKTETASRLRGRIEAVLSWATVAGHRTGDNPARWAGNLKELLPAASKVAKADNQPALALADAPAWWAELAKRDGMAARALEFLTLTAARSGEVRGATWDEIAIAPADPAAPHKRSGVWTIPGSRMKNGREHRVPLTAEAVAVLEALPRLDGNPLLFFAPRGGMLSDMSVSAVLRRMQEAEEKAGRAGWLDPQSKRPAVPHGLRSTFRQWAAERGFPRDMSEIALAHWIGTEVERAYQRADMLERRRAMMAAWAAFLRGEQAEGGNVVQIAGVAG